MAFAVAPVQQAYGQQPQPQVMGGGYQAPAGPGPVGWGSASAASATSTLPNQYAPPPPQGPYIRPLQERLAAHELSRPTAPRILRLPDIANGMWAMTSERYSAGLTAYEVFNGINPSTDPMLAARFPHWQTGLNTDPTYKGKLADANRFLDQVTGNLDAIRVQDISLLSLASDPTLNTRLQGLLGSFNVRHLPESSQALALLFNTVSPSILTSQQIHDTLTITKERTAALDPLSKTVESRLPVLRHASAALRAGQELNMASAGAPQTAETRASRPGFCARLFGSCSSSDTVAEQPKGTHAMTDADARSYVAVLDKKFPDPKRLDVESEQVFTEIKDRIATAREPNTLVEEIKSRGLSGTLGAAQITFALKFGGDQDLVLSGLSNMSEIFKRSMKPGAYLSFLDAAATIIRQGNPDILINGVNVHGQTGVSLSSLIHGLRDIQNENREQIGRLVRGVFLELQIYRQTNAGVFSHPHLLAGVVQLQNNLLASFPEELRGFNRVDVHQAQTEAPKRSDLEDIVNGNDRQRYDSEMKVFNDATRAITDQFNAEVGNTQQHGTTHVKLDQGFTGLSHQLAALQAAIPQNDPRVFNPSDVQKGFWRQNEALLKAPSPENLAILHARLEHGGNAKHMKGKDYELGRMKVEVGYLQFQHLNQALQSAQPRQDMSHVTDMMDDVLGFMRAGYEDMARDEILFKNRGARGKELDGKLYGAHKELYAYFLEKKDTRARGLIDVAYSKLNSKFQLGLRLN